MTNDNARHWSAPDAEEEVWHNWPSGPVWSARRLCDDGALLLRPKERRLFDQALAAARLSSEHSAFAYEDDLCVGVNLQVTGRHGADNPGRWALSNRERYLSGGFVAPLPNAYEVQLPDLHIDADQHDSRVHVEPTDVRVRQASGVGEAYEHFMIDGPADFVRATKRALKLLRGTAGAEYLRYVTCIRAAEWFAGAAGGWCVGTEIEFPQSTWRDLDARQYAGSISHEAVHASGVNGSGDGERQCRAVEAQVLRSLGMPTGHLEY